MRYQSLQVLLLKALHSTSGSDAHACPVEEQVFQSMAVADLNLTKFAPRIINVDKNVAYPKAIAELKAAGFLAESVELRQAKYLNNLIEQDHRLIKRLVKPGLSFFSVETAWSTLQRYESMNITRKGQVHGVGKRNIIDQVAFIASLFG